MRYSENAAITQNEKKKTEITKNETREKLHIEKKHGENNESVN
jgi:hypothetical protein